MKKSDIQYEIGQYAPGEHMKTRLRARLNSGESASPRRYTRLLGTLAATAMLAALIAVPVWVMGGRDTDIITSTPGMGGEASSIDDTVNEIPYVAAGWIFDRTDSNASSKYYISHVQIILAEMIECEAFDVSDITEWRLTRDGVDVKLTLGNVHPAFFDSETDLAD